MRALTKIWVFLGLLVFLFVGSAEAVPIIIDFGTGDAGPGGVMTRVGNNVSGTGIGLDNLTILNAPSNNGLFDLTGAFTTGSDGSDAVLNFDTGIAKNFITIVGGVPALGIPLGTTLLSGSFASWAVDGGGGAALLTLSNATGPDVKSPLLLSQIGATGTPFAFSDGFSISALNNAGAYIAFSVDIPNTGKVPEPISLILLGSGLAGAGLYRRLRKP